MVGGLAQLDDPVDGGVEVAGGEEVVEGERVGGGGGVLGH